MFERLLGDWFRRLDGPIEASERGWAKVEVVLGAGFDFFAANPDYVRLVRREALDSGAHIGLDLAAVLRPMWDLAVGYLQREMDAGTFRRHDPEQLLLTGYGALLSYFSDAPFLEGLLDTEPLHEAALATRRTPHHVVLQDGARSRRRVPCEPRGPGLPSPAMATINVGGRVIGYAADGPDDATPLLLFHGTTMDRAAWDMVRPAMTGTYRFVMVEFPGSGESSMPDGPLTVEGLASDGLAVMDHLGIDRFHVAGYSLGAVVALGLAAIAPQRVASVTSLCGWATTDPRMKFTFDLWKRLIETDPELFMRYAVADGFTVDAIAALEPMLADVISLGAASHRARARRRTSSSTSASTSPTSSPTSRARRSSSARSRIAGSTSATAGSSPPRSRTPGSPSCRPGTSSSRSCRRTSLARSTRTSPARTRREPRRAVRAARRGRRRPLGEVRQLGPRRTSRPTSGCTIEELRTDYCRMRMPFRPELEQAGGVVHGGAIATLLDTVVVPAVGSAYDREARFSTVDMHVQFLSALIGEDAIGEGWVVKRGRSVVFCESEVTTAADRQADRPQRPRPTTSPSCRGSGFLGVVRPILDSGHSRFWPFTILDVSVAGAETIAAQNREPPPPARRVATVGADGRDGNDALRSCLEGAAARVRRADRRRARRADCRRPRSPRQRSSASRSSSS